MYTRCPHCNTIFQVTAEQLRMAQGDIDCVTCQQNFDAVESLADDVTMLIGAAEARFGVADTSGDLSEEMAGNVHEDQDEALDEDQAFFATLEEASIDEETVWPVQTEDSEAEPADDDFETAQQDVEVVEQQDDGTDDEIRAAADIGEDEDYADDDRQAGDSLEFDAPEQTWTKYFLTDSQNVTPNRREPWIGSQDPEALEEATGNQSEWASFLEELNVGEEAQRSPEGPVSALEAELEAEFEPELQAEFESEPGPADSADDDNGDEPVSLLAPWLVVETKDETAAEPPAEKRHGPFAALIAGLALLLVAQLVHYNRDSLATNPAYGPMIRQVYRTLDTPLYPEWPLDVFEVTGTEAIAGRSSPETLDVLANVVVGGRERVGLPLVRIVLRDRWATPIASRVFAPAEYLVNYDPAEPLVRPGSAFAVEISVADPGAEALGYIVDICLPRRKFGLECQIAKDPFQ